jgi:Family of unknown function (DUF6152)
MSVSRAHNAWVSGICVSTILIIGVAANLFAHHSQSQFDVTKTITLEGTLTAVSWSNPHSFFFLSGKPIDDKDAAVQRWAIEGPSPLGMERYGWTKETAKPGTKIIMSGNPRRDGKPDLLLLSITVDGKKVTFKPE